MFKFLELWKLKAHGLLICRGLFKTLVACWDIDQVGHVVSKVVLTRTCQCQVPWLTPHTKLAGRDQLACKGVLATVVDAAEINPKQLHLLQIRVQQSLLKIARLQISIRQRGERI